MTHPNIVSQLLVVLFPWFMATWVPDGAIATSPLVVVSTSTARLPGSISSVINDLEAEGITKLATIAFFTSRGVSLKQRSELIQSIFFQKRLPEKQGTDGDGSQRESAETATEEEEEAWTDLTTAFGSKLILGSSLSRWVTSSHPKFDRGNHERKEGEKAEEEEKIGLVVATPSYSTTILSDLSSTVQACGGTILFAVDSRDLKRGGIEGVFDVLAPTIEHRIQSILSGPQTWTSSIATPTTSTNKKNLPMTHHKIIILILGLQTDESLDEAKQIFGEAATSVLANMGPHKTGTHSTTLTMDQIFDQGVHFLSASTIPSDQIYEILFPPADSTLDTDEPQGYYTDPATATAKVATPVPQDYTYLSSVSKTLAQSPIELAAVRKLLPISRQAYEFCISTIAQVAVLEQQQKGEITPSYPIKNVKLIGTFGEIADAAVKRALEFFDTQAISPLAKADAADSIPKLTGQSDSVSQSIMAKRIRSNLIRDMNQYVNEMYELQLEQLYMASMESFKAGLSKLRLSPNLASDMQNVAKLTIQAFHSASKKICPKTISSSSILSSSSIVENKLARELREYIALRLQAARADGKFRPIPRKGFNIGLHWLLPKPFGNDYRQEPWMVHTNDNIIYVPKDKITDVKKEEILGQGTDDGNVKISSGGDWRKNIVPCPTANELMYMK